MEVLSNWLSSYKTLHHAHLIIGDRETAISKLEDFFEASLNFSTKGNPDYWKEEFNLFGIDESRRIIETHSRKGFRSDKKIFVLSFNSISQEAQNALLKMFEEPVFGTHFFVIVPTIEMIIPTLRSRFLVINAVHKIDRDELKTATLFIQSSIGERMSIVADFVEKKDMEKIESLFRGLEMLCHQDGVILNKNIHSFLNDLFLCEKYIRDRASSVKLLLEYLALVTPKML